MAEQLVPENRLERFLSSIVYNTDVPDERRTRLELCLGAILKRNAPPDAPYDRLERWLKEIYENADYAAQFSGLNVEFWSEGNEQIKSIIVDIIPYQDLHGYDSPWPPGLGKNLVDVPNFTLIKGSERTKGINLGTAIPPGTYTLSCNVTNHENATVNTVISLRTAAGSQGTGLFSLEIPANYVGKVQQTVTITSDVGYIYIYMIMDNPDAATITIEDFQLEAGDAATSFAPYANVCPITGFDALTLTRYGETASDNPLTVTVSFGGTVYGGTLNVLTGELTVTNQEHKLAIADMNNNDAYPGWTGQSWLRDSFGDNWQRPITSTNSIINLANKTAISVNTRSANNVLYISRSVYDLSQSEWKERYSDLVMQIVVPLISPLKYSLTPNQVATLVGTNHIMADVANGDLSLHANVTVKV